MLRCLGLKGFPLRLPIRKDSLLTVVPPVPTPRLGSGRPLLEISSLSSNHVHKGRQDISFSENPMGQ